jgi:hypothetical protein
LHAQADVALADDLFADAAVGIDDAGQVDDRNADLAILQGGDQAVFAERGDTGVGDEVAGAAVHRRGRRDEDFEALTAVRVDVALQGFRCAGEGRLARRVDVDRLIAVRVEQANFQLPCVARHQGERAGIDVGLDGQAFFAGVVVVTFATVRVEGQRRGVQIERRGGLDQAAIAVNALQHEQGRADAGGVDQVAGIVDQHGAGQASAQAGEVGGAEGEIGGVGDGDGLLVREVDARLEARELATGQRRQWREMDLQQSCAADVDGQLDGRAGGEAVVGLQRQRRCAAVAGFRGEADFLAVGFESGAAVSAAENAPEECVAFEVFGDIAQGAARGQAGVRLECCRSGCTRRGRLIGPEAGIGVEELAIGAADLAVAVDIGQWVWVRRRLVPRPGCR